MSGSWSWTYLDGEGRTVSGGGLVTSGFPSQSEAESWLGEEWRSLADGGVEAVTLTHDGAVVYGPMSLRGAQ